MRPLSLRYRWTLGVFAFVLALIPAVVLPGALSAQAEAPGAIDGHVLSSLGDPVPGATVTLVGTTRSTVTGADGGFTVDSLRPGQYRLHVESARFGMTSQTVTIESGKSVTVELQLDLVIHGDDVVVTANPDARTLSEVAQPASVLSGEDLAREARSSLGETLAQQPGVSSTSFGAGASRPVIRGQGGNRIRILENGVESGDVSDTSPDHAVALEPLDADKVEVVRGPATLLYGSNAIGGVVNVIDGRIPEHLPGAPIEGAVSLVGASNADERSADVSLDGGVGSVAWHASGFDRKAGDYSSGDGTVPNSDVAANGGSLGFSLIGDSGFIGVAGRRYDSNYGNPAEEDVRLDLSQRRLDLRAGLTRRLGIFDGLRLRFGRTDYEHTELEGPEVGTRFLNESWEARIDAPHRPLGPFRGSVGVQVSNRKFQAIGEEAFVPPTDNDSWAAFVFEEIGTGKVRAQVGLRQEQQDSSAIGQSDRSFSGTSGSLGGVWHATDGLTAALTVSRAVKLPDPEELYADGPHIATRVFEIGDPNLTEETATGLDLTLRKTSSPVRGLISLFANRFNGYVFAAFTGETRVLAGSGEELPIVRFEQADAEIWGAEAEAHIDLYHADPQHLELELTSDFVRGELRDSGEPLPRTPPLRFGAGLRYRSEHLSSTLFVRRTDKQNRVAANETPTDGFTTLDASFGYRFFRGNLAHEILLSGDNLTDELARNHVSFIKDVAPLPGRDIRLTYKLLF